jgi:CheY-like chemotaxis protein
MSDYLLLIEDDEDHAELAMFFINEQLPDTPIRHLCDGEQALALIEKIAVQEEPAPWLILLDLKVPRYDGIEILNRIKTTTELTKCPVVVFTTSCSNRDIQAAYEGQANSYILKPTDPNMYEQTIGQILQYWTLDQHHRLYPSKANHD